MKIEVGPSRFKSVGEKRLQVSRQKSTRLDLTRLTPNTTWQIENEYIFGCIFRKKLDFKILIFWTFCRNSQNSVKCSVRSQSTQVESSRFLTTDLKSIFTDWLETTSSNLEKLEQLDDFYV